MKTLILALLTIASIAVAQDKTVVSPLPPQDFSAIENFGQTLLHSSGVAVGFYPSAMLGKLPEGSKATDRYGAGGFILYPVSQFAWVGLRLDYISGHLWAPSATLGAKYTLDKLPMRPTFFTVGGLVYSVSGAGVSNDSVGAIAGLGVIGNIKTSNDGRYTLDVFLEAEKWTNLPGEIVHGGLMGGIKF